MKVLVDTNVWLDVALGRERFYEASYVALCTCIDDDDEICVAATSLKDVFYLVEKLNGASSAYRAIRGMLSLASVLTVDDFVCRRALDLERPDYEDGIVAATALTDSVDAILTRDADAFTNLEIPKYPPAEFVKIRGYEPIQL